MKVPSKDYGRQYRELWDELEPALRRAFLEDDPILGDAVTRFEAALARYHGVPHAVGLGTGTDAIVLMLRELGVGAGDEVVTCAHTFSGVPSAILLAGATPVLCDPDGSGRLASSAVEAALTPRTRAILAVHLYGCPVDLEPLLALAARKGILLLEDAAQAHGALYRGRPVGSFGRAAILSFHPSKNLGAFGDGGALLTADEELAARVRVARNLGKGGKYDFVRVASNTKLDTIQAAILEVKLGHLERWVARRRELAAIYHHALRGVGDLVLPLHDPEGSRHAYHLFVVRTERRDALRQHLAARGIRAGLHYPIAAHQQPGLAPTFAGARLPAAEAWARSVLTLPLSHELEEEEIHAVCAEVRGFFEGSR